MTFVRGQTGELSPGFKHGHANSCDRRASKTYDAWFQMRQRCERTTHLEYKNYGERGIKVCERWSEFRNFLADMGEAPAGLSLDRINNNGGYEPGNCRWVTPTEQARNTRLTVFVELRGETKPLSEWCEIYEINKSTVLKRVRRSGWDWEDAITTPRLWAR